ncbi:AsmA family protein [Plastoroseomonas hellenica]|uniref:AsmA family protein n=1 Tax=Plastoroseomonas hellenica TaxID=2687306 RepID=UPI001BAB23CC|nr:AsmA-like C-terminal region-containing protein [Plastoroseomonas hellenica]MBR0644977.1 AsmA family protein [Plastoroseomonas hellenica]
MTRSRAAIAVSCILGILALIGAGLWFGPMAVDWEAQRGRLASLAARELGRPVSLDGPVRLTLLPRPMVEASGVVVGGEAGGIGVTARALRLTLNLPALLLARLEPREVVLVGAEIRLPWPPGNAPALRPPPWLTGFAARIEDGRIVVGDTVLNDVAARLTAGGPLDAVRAEGRFAWRGQAMDFHAVVGRPGFDGIATLDLTLAAGGATGRARGVLVEDGGFEGRVEAFGPDLSALLPTPAMGFRANGRLTVSAELLAADDLTIDLGGAPARGALTLRLAPAPRLDVALSAARLDLDAWTAALRGAGRPLMPTAIDLSAEAAGFRGITLRRLRGGIFREGERVTFSDVAAVLPGEMEIELAGASAGTRLELALRFAGPDLRATLASFGLPVEGVQPERLRATEGRARLVLEETQLAVPEMGATVDGARLTGGGVWRFGARPSLGIGVAIDMLDLDGLVPQWPDWPAAAAKLGGADVNLRFAADALTLRGQRVERAAVDAALEGGRLAVRRLSGRAAGADLAFSGTATLAATPRFSDLSLEVVASSARGLFDLLPTGWQPEAALAEQPLALRVAGGGPAEALALRAEGELAELRIESQATLDTGARRVQGALTLRHPGAPRLLSALWQGRDMSWVGEGSFSLITSLLVGPAGATAENFELVAGLLRTRGALILALGAERPRLAGRLTSERLPLPDPPWRSTEPLGLAALGGIDAEIALAAQRIEMPDLPPIEDAKAALRLTGGTLDITGLEARVSGGALGGEVSIATPPGAAPRARLSLRLSGASVTGPLLGLPIDVTSGLTEAELALEAEGHSPAALAASLSGSLRLGVRDGALAGLDLSALQAAAGVLEPEPGLRRALEGGVTGFERLDLAATIDGGVARIAQAALAGPAGPAAASGQVDLARGTLDVAITARPGAAEAPEVALRLQGLLADPQRVVELADWARWRAMQQ